MQRKLLLLLWALLTTALPTTAADFTVDGISYNFTEDGNAVHVSSCGYRDVNSYTLGKSTMIIPDNIIYNGKAYPIVAIDANACSGALNIGYLSIGNNVKEIGSRAFYGCNYVNTLILGENLEIIGDNSFGGDNKSGAASLTSITIPSKVRSIGFHAFSYHTKLSNVTIKGNNIEDIGADAFYDTAWLNNQQGVIYAGNAVLGYNGAMPNNTTIDIKDGTTVIGRSAFSGRSQMSSIIIPETLKKIQGDAFYGCSGLTNINLPNTINSIEGGAFNSCSGLKSVSIPNSITKIEGGLFYKCSGLTSVTIPNSITSIGVTAFYGCSGLTTIDLPNSVTTIDRDAFNSCIGLTSVTIPNSITSIGDNAFYSCSGLTSATIGISVTSIGSKAFYNCNRLTSISIPYSVTYIGDGAFSGCSGVKVLTYDAKEITNYSFLDGISNVDNLILGDNMTEIPSALMTKFSNLKSITLGNLITSIPNNAFSGKTKLESVTMKKVTDIGNYAFSGCTNLATLSMPNTVKNLGSYAFQGCTSLKNINISTSLQRIKRAAFMDCKALESITLPASIKAIEPQAFIASGLTSVSLPSQLKELTDSTFMNCVSLENISFPTTLTNINNRTFQGCTGLTTITLPNLVTSIGDYAFSNCKGLTSITVPASVESLGTGAFSSCHNITKAVLPNSVKVIQNALFQDCVLLNSITLGNAVQSIGDNAFYSCTTLKSLTLPTTVTSIGSYAFQNCSGLTSLTIPAAVTNIGAYAFRSCTGLTSLTIPAAVTNIGSYAFQGCNGVTTLNYRAKALTNPQNINGMSEVATVNFDGTATVVPAGLLSNFSKLDNVSIGKNVASIESGAFNNCNALTTLTYNAAKCETGELNIRSLKTLNIGANVSEILTDKAFYNCPGLNLILFKGTTPPMLKSYQTFPQGSFLTLENKSAASSFKSKYKSVWTAAGYSGAPILPYPMNKLAVTNLSNYSASAIGYAVSDNINYTEAGFIVGGSAKTKSSTLSKDNTNNTVAFNVENIPNLLPGSSYKVEPYVIVDGTEYVDVYGGTLNVPAMQSNYNSIIGPSTVILDDATVIPDKIKFKSATLTLNNKTYESYGNTIIVTGLKPNNYYSGSYSVEVSEGGINSANFNIYTPSLTLSTQPATMLTNTAAMLQSYTNLSEEETSCGFLWKRYDAPDEMLGNPVYCPVFDGMMMGTLKNMPEGVYYKYRAFYRANDGQMYYGDWVAFYTGDATIEFEPVAHTYNNARVSNVNAIIQGIALRGSKDITEQGFEYWIDNTAKVGTAPLDSLDVNMLKAAAGSVNKVKATGERMSATLDGLRAGSTYLFRAYVKTAAGTTYGELRSFTVPKQEISGDLNGDGNVNAGDVSELYSAILRGAGDTTYDLNNDGNVNAGDISTLYSIILGQ